MNLIGGEQVMRVHLERRRHARTVLGNIGRRIIGSGPAVEAGIDSLGDTDLTREEGVADTRKRAERIGLQYACHCLVPGLLARISCRHYRTLMPRNRAGARVSGRP